MKRITVLGNFSGRNAGDNAILGNLLTDISALYNDIQFIIPTWNTNFVEKHFGQFNIKAVGLKPWNGALKIFGYPTYKAMTETDLILITDNILFDRSFYNPLFNYLSTIALFMPAVRKRNIPVFPYNASLGPVSTDAGRRAMQKIMHACPCLSIRDKQSLTMLDNNGIEHKEVIEGADCAINTIPPEEKRIEEIIAENNLFKNPEGTLGFNINSYINSWQKSTDGNNGLSREQFLQIISESLDRIIDNLGVEILFMITQVMDTAITHEALGKTKNKNNIKVVSNADYTYQELTGLLARCGLHVGMRTHSLILASSVVTPMITINSYPKSKGYVQTIGQGDWVIELTQLQADNLVQMVQEGWQKRLELKENMRPEVEREQKKAKNTATIVGKLLGK